jgi:hypothetical protein
MLSYPALPSTVQLLAAVRFSQAEDHIMAHGHIIPPPRILVVDDYHSETPLPTFNHPTKFVRSPLKTASGSATSTSVQ